MAYTVNRLEYGARTTERGINLYIEQEKHKLDWIAARNIKMSLDKHIDVGRKAMASPKDNHLRTNGNDLPTELANSYNPGTI